MSAVVVAGLPLALELIPLSVIVGLFVSEAVAESRIGEILNIKREEKLGREVVTLIHISLLEKVKKREEELKERYNISFNFFQELKRVSNREIKFFNPKRETIELKNFRTKVNQALFELNSLEREELKSMQKRIERIKNLKLPTHKLLKDDLLEIKEGIEEINKTLFFREKIDIVNRIFYKIEEYQKNYQIIKREEELREYINSKNFENLKEERVVIKSKREKLLEEIRVFKEKIKNYNINYNRFENLEDENSEKLKLILSNIKLDYGKIKRDFINTILYKENLKSLLSLILDDKLKEEIEALLSKEIIKREEFNTISNKIGNSILLQQQKSKLINSIKNSLIDLGYELFSENQEIVEKLERGEIIYLNSDKKEYKIMLKMKNNLLSSRFVRVVGSEKEKESISTYQKERDREEAKKWCKTYDKLVKLLEKEGIILNEKIRIEPMEQEISYIVDEKFVTTQESSKKSQLKIDKNRI